MYLKVIKKILIFITFLSFYNSLGINKSVQEISTIWARSVPDDRTFPFKELERIEINTYMPFVLDG